MTAKQATMVHPMVPVPEAIRTVLRETSRVLLTPNAKPKPTIRISSKAHDSEIVGHVLDEDVLMTDPGYPPYNASIMDGYAIRTSEYLHQNGAALTARESPVASWTHRVVDKVYAGSQHPPVPAHSELGTSPCSSNTFPPAYYITTGAVVPDSCDCVVPIEDCVVSDDNFKIQIKPTAQVERNKWIRPIGCDIPPASIVLPRGHTIDGVALGLLKQSGADSIVAKRPIIVGVLSTGNELILGPNDNPLQPGKIPDVNRPILLSLLSSFGRHCEPIDLGTERDDDVESMAATILQALDHCDVIITTAGISMGETDIVEHVLVEKCGGTLHFGRMNMKPGKPTTFVTIPKRDAVRLVFAMPGNPVSATVCTQLLVRPCIDLLFYGPSDNVTSNATGPLDIWIDSIVENSLVQQELEATLTHDITLDPQRPEYHRVTMHRAPDSTLLVTTTGNQRSSRLMSCRDAQALLVLPAATPSKPRAVKGESHLVLLLGGLRGMGQLQVKHSRHLEFNKPARQAKVAVVEVLPEAHGHLTRLDEISFDVQNALSGSNSGGTVTVSKKTFHGSMDKLYSEVVDCHGADFVIVCCISFPGSFLYHLEVVSTLREQLVKPAKALALQARQGAASENPAAALFEVVVGYAPAEQGVMVICLSDAGLIGGLQNVRGLLKHALNLGRGKVHNHHHSHQDHEHTKVHGS